MNFNDILYGVSDKVAAISLNRPDKMNALSINLLRELTKAVEQAPEDGARAIVLTGEGRAFCSGADLTSGEIPDDLSAYLAEHYEPLLHAMKDCNIPIVTAINGPAVGAGLSIALQGDLVVMARSAYLLLAFANIGLVPDAGVTWSLTRSVGRARAMEMALLAEKLGAEAAMEYGLVNQLANDEDVKTVAREIAVRLAHGPSFALGCIRKQVDAACELDFESVLEVERAHQAACGQTSDFKSAILAFAEKRKPVFEGK